jgi:hypothetical protein
MGFRVYRGKPIVAYFKKTDTTVNFVDGSAVMLNTSGALALPSNDSNDRILGVCQKNIAAKDSDNNVPVILATEDVEWEVETDSDGGASSTDVGRFCALDTGDTTNPRATVDVSDSTIPHFLITQVVSATKVRGRFARTTLRKPATDRLDT